MANKQDLDGVKRNKEITEIFKINDLRKKYKHMKIKVFETSVVNNTGINVAFDWLCEKMVGE